MNTPILRNGLAIGIMLLFIVSALTPMVFGCGVETSDEKTMIESNNNYSISKQLNECSSLFNRGWTEQDKLTAADGAADDQFGGSVSIDGDYAVIGATHDDGERGSAYVFIRSGTTWTQQAKLTASDGGTGDRFGLSVSINGDYTVIGAAYDNFKKGSAYVFIRSGTTWTQQAKLTASDGEFEDYFGFSVSIDGDYVVIGAPMNDDFGTNSGSAYVFKRSGTTWTQQAKLIGSSSEAYGWFGKAVSIKGEYTVIGAPYENSEIGFVYVFKRSGTTWTEEDKLTGSDVISGDDFGNSVSIDGDYAVIGADTGNFFEGAAYVFIRSGTTWTEEAKLVASDGLAWDYFGLSVSIDDDCIMSGAFGNNDVGSAYVFKRSGTTWTEEAKLVASDGVDDDRFGRSVSIDGNYALIGAYFDDDNGVESGSAYVFIKEVENQPPNAPTITGETNGKKGTEYEYTFNSVDPDGDNVKYHIDWDDGDSDTTAFSSSGADVKVKHTWSNQGTFTIKATAEDTNGLVGPEGTLSASMPRNRAMQTPFLQFLQNFLQQHQILYQLLLRFLRF